jgi:hypothetical protein
MYILGVARILLFGVSLSQQYHDKLHIATCFDFQEVIFRPSELIVFNQLLVHVKF